MDDKPKRRWLRFSLRTMFVLWTIACLLLFACWTLTKTMGVDDVARRYIRPSGSKFGPSQVANATRVGPLVVRVTIDRYPGIVPNQYSIQQTHLPSETAYCLWFFGLVVELPI
jgi:hypothetical protein